MKSKSSTRVDLRKEFDDIISIQKFLKLFCGIENEGLFKHKLTHDDVKELMPTLVRVGFDYILKTRNEVLSGNVILVEDGNGFIVPYKNPTIVEEFSNGSYQIDIEKVIKTQTDKFESIIISEDLSDHELEELCKRYKKDKRFGEYRAVAKLLKKRKEDIKTYKKRKCKLVEEERIGCDEY